MLLTGPERHMLFNRLGAMEARRKSCSRSEVVGTMEKALAPFKILDSCARDIERMPVDLAISIVAMAVEGWDDASKTRILGPWADFAVGERFRELATYVVADYDFIPVYFNQLVTNCKCILRSKTKGDQLD